MRRPAASILDHDGLASPRRLMTSELVVVTSTESQHLVGMPPDGQTESKSAEAIYLFAEIGHACIDGDDAANAKRYRHRETQLSNWINEFGVKGPAIMLA